MRPTSVRIASVLASASLFALYSRVELPWAWLGWVALVPWLIGLDRERTMGATIASGAAMSIAFTIAVFAWFAEAFARYTQTPVWLAFALLVVTAPLVQPQFIGFAIARYVLSSRGAIGFPASIAAALAWCAVEWALPRVLGDTLGHGVQPFATFRQGADLAGAPGLTFVLLVVNQQLHGALAQWPTSRPRAYRDLATAVAVVAALGGYGLVRLHQVASRSPSRAPFSAALVQANVGDYEDLGARLGTFEATREILDLHVDHSDQAVVRASTAEGIDLIVWPETVYPTTFGSPKSPAGAELDGRIVRFVERSGIALLFGAYDRDPDGEYNAAVLLDVRADGVRPPEFYRKRRLFPLTETVPSWLESKRLRQLLPWLGTWRPGAEGTLLRLGAGSDEVVLAPMICLDAVDPGLAVDAANRGADLILTISNDGWFADGPGARLHLTVSSFRSIETRLPQLRATNTGISAVIDASGEIPDRAEVGQSTALVGTVVPGRRGHSLMVLWGNWFGPAAFVLAPIVGFLAIRRSRRVDRIGRETETPRPA